jgi:2-amino-4-hydroxy-6-hydroxymethyldihydropteridine diphosphokinase
MRNNPVHNCYIGIGSNLADPLQQVIDVLPQLDGIHSTRLMRHSSLYRSEPVSDIEQEDYINAVAQLHTELSPVDLLLELQAIEQAFYRDRAREKRWGPRTMDLDILLFDNLRQHDSHLTLPHPRLHERQFVLQPLREIAGDLYFPGLGSLDYLIQQAPRIRIERLTVVNGLK